MFIWRIKQSCWKGFELVNNPNFKGPKFAVSTVRRYSCGASPWKKLRCPICDHEKDDVIHILTGCSKLYLEQTLKYKEELKTFYIEEHLPPSNSDEELALAILNGNCFVKETSIVQLKKREKAAHTIASPGASLICNDVHVQRDLLMSEATLDPDLDVTIPYGEYVYSWIPCYQPIRCRCI